MSFSKVGRSDALAMGVQIQSAVMLDRLAQEIEESGIPEKFKYSDRSDILSSDYKFFGESDGTKAFRSTVGHTYPGLLTTNISPIGRDGCPNANIGTCFRAHRQS